MLVFSSLVFLRPYYLLVIHLDSLLPVFHLNSLLILVDVNDQLILGLYEPLPWLHKRG